jgi:hypothetical protein
MKSATHSRYLTYIVVFLFLLVASFLAGSMAQPAQPANAQDIAAAAAPNLPAGAYQCTIGYVAVYAERIQVWCPPGTGGIDNFAAPFASAGESRQTNRFLALLISAFALNKQVVIWYADAPAANPPGCDQANCRRIEGVVMQ